MEGTNIGTCPEARNFLPNVYSKDINTPKLPLSPLVDVVLSCSSFSLITEKNDRVFVEADTFEKCPSKMNKTIVCLLLMLVLSSYAINVEVTCHYLEHDDELHNLEAVKIVTLERGLFGGRKIVLYYGSGIQTQSIGFASDDEAKDVYDRIKTRCSV